MPDRADAGAGRVGGAGRAQGATGSPCATPRSRPHRDGSPPCFLSDISGWSLSLVGGVPPRRLLAAVADSVLANAGSGRRWRRRGRRRAGRWARGAGRAAARPQIEPPDTAAAPRYGVAAPVGGSVKMTLDSAPCF